MLQISFLNISKQGMTDFGNEDNVGDLDPEGIEKLAKANPDLVVGVGAGADISVLRLDHGKFGLTDSAGARKIGDRMLAAEMTIRQGEVVWDLNGRASLDWEKFPYDKTKYIRTEPSNR